MFHFFQYRLLFQCYLTIRTLHVLHIVAFIILPLQGTHANKIYWRLFSICYDWCDNISNFVSQIFISDDRTYCMSNSFLINFWLFTCVTPDLRAGHLSTGVTLSQLSDATLTMIKAGIQENEIWLPRVPDLLQATLSQLKEAEEIFYLEPKESHERRWLYSTQEAIRTARQMQQEFGALTIAPWYWRGPVSQAGTSETGGDPWHWWKTVTQAETRDTDGKPWNRRTPVTKKMPSIIIEFYDSRTQQCDVHSYPSVKNINTYWYQLCVFNKVSSCLGRESEASAGRDVFTYSTLE